MIREIIDIYNRNWMQILIWSIVIILPITTVSFLGVVYVNGSEEVMLPHYLSGLVFFLNFILCIPPFMKMVLIDEQDELITSLEGIFFFVKQFGLLLLLTILFYVMAIMGMYLFFIPTVISMLFLLIFPFFSDGRTVKEVVLQTFKAMAKENFSLIGDLIIIISINLGLWAVIMMFIEQYENNIFAYLLIRNAMNILIFPIIYIYLTLRYRKEESFESQYAKGW